MHIHWTISIILLPLIKGTFAQDEGSTTTIFQTTRHTYTITRNDICTPLQRCENLTWSPIFESNTTATSGSTSSTGSISTTSQALPTSRNSDIPSEFLLQGDGQFSGYYIAFGASGHAILVREGESPQYLQLSALGQLRTSATPTEVVFLRITNDTILHRREETQFIEVGDVLHDVPGNLLGIDKTGTFYFLGVTLKLNWRGLVYTFYGQKSIGGIYILMMAREGSVIPSSYFPLNLNYVGRPSSTSSSRPTSTSTNSSSGSPSSSTSTPTALLAYDIITSYSYQAFCSQFLQYSGTVTVTSSTGASTATGVSSSIETITDTSTSYSSIETVYTTTNYTTQASRRMGRDLSMSMGFERRQSKIPTPSLLATFADGQIRAGCSSAVPVPNTSTEFTTTTTPIPYESTTQGTTTSTSGLTTVSTSTATGPFETELAVNGYWKIDDPSVTNFNGEYIRFLHDDTGTIERYLTKAATSDTFFNMAWNETVGAWNAYCVWTYQDSGSPVTEILWLWYYDRTDFTHITPRVSTEEEVANEIGIRKAEFLVDNDGYGTLVPSDGNGPVFWACIWSGLAAARYGPLVMFGNFTDFQDSLNQALVAAGYPFPVSGCEPLLRFKIVASNGT
ncbi:hypothetical protein TWF281_008711 [Arthrobotrys megalospora]